MPLAIWANFLFSLTLLLSLSLSPCSLFIQNMWSNRQFPIEGERYVDRDRDIADAGRRYFCVFVQLQLNKCRYTASFRKFANLDLFPTDMYWLPFGALNSRDESNKMSWHKSDY